MPKIPSMEEAEAVKEAASWSYWFMFYVVPALIPLIVSGIALLIVRHTMTQTVLPQLKSDIQKNQNDIEKNEEKISKLEREVSFIKGVGSVNGRTSAPENLTAFDEGATS